MSSLYQGIIIGDRKLQILRAATQIVASEGSGELTTPALARATGMTLGALQVHFRAGEDVLRQLAPYTADEYRQGRRRADSQKRG
jgi:AcrR family transcriptional regulator